MTEEKQIALLGITASEFDTIISRAMLKAKATSQDTVPIDTGNMRYASYKDEHLGVCKYRVYFNMQGKHKDGELDGIAPYVRYTNERPIRTQGWFDDKTVPTFVKEFANTLQFLLSGVIKEDFSIEISEVKQ